MIGMVALRTRGNVGSACVVVERIDDNFVMVDDGNKRQRCNLSHLEFVEKNVSSTDKIREELLSLGFEIPEKKQRFQKAPSKAAPKVSKPKKK